MRPGSYPALGCGAVAAPLVVRETAPPPSPTPRLLDRVRSARRLRHYSRRTEEAPVAWVRQYIVLHDKRHRAGVPRPRASLLYGSGLCLLECCGCRTLNRGRAGVRSPIDTMLLGDPLDRPAGSSGLGDERGRRDRP